MNAERRKALTLLQGEMMDIVERLNQLKDEEQDYKDNMPENMQSGEKGDKADTAISELETAIENIESASANIDEAIA